MLEIQLGFYPYRENNRIAGFLSLPQKLLHVKYEASLMSIFIV